MPDPDDPDRSEMVVGRVYGHPDGNLWFQGGYAHPEGGTLDEAISVMLRDGWLFAPLKGVEDTFDTLRSTARTRLDLDS